MCGHSKRRKSNFRNIEIKGNGKDRQVPLSLSIPSFETKRNIKNVGKNRRERTKKEKEGRKETKAEEKRTNKLETN